MNKISNKFFAYIHDYFTIYLPNQKGCSPNTIRSYKQDLNGLLHFIMNEKHINIMDIGFQTITAAVFSEYLDYVENIEGNCVTTRNRKHISICSFYKYVSIMDPTLTSYYSEIKTIPRKKAVKSNIVDYLSENAIKALLRAPNAESETGLRDQVYMILSYDTAARIDEILHIKLRDISLTQTPQILLHGKGKKDRYVPVMKETIPHLKKYISIYHPDCNCYSDEYLFYSLRNGKKEPIHSDTIRKMLKKYAAKLHESMPEIPADIHPHLFRHSRAMHLYQHGMELTLISQWLGHSSLQTTLVYAHADTEMKRKAISLATDDIVKNISPTKNGYSIADDEVLLRLLGL